MVTQLEIAKEVGIDVSSVNKILNRVPGPVFRKETIRLVFKVARARGYDFNRKTKPLLQRRVEELEKILSDLVPRGARVDQLASIYNRTPLRITEIMEFLYGKKGA